MHRKSFNIIVLSGFLAISQAFAVAPKGHQKLSGQTLVDFAKASYAVHHEDMASQVPPKRDSSPDERALLIKLIGDGYELVPFRGTTGSANEGQVESIAGVIGFKDLDVVIALRGTEMTDLNDWCTNFRTSRDGIGTRVLSYFGDLFNRAYGGILGKEQHEHENYAKRSAITSNYFYNLSGEISNGVLESHESYWEFLVDAINARITTMRLQGHKNIAPKDLYYTVTGHSKGGGKANLVALNLLTELRLGIGVSHLDNSVMLNDSVVGDFYAISHKTRALNQGNVELVTFEAPRVLSAEAARQAKEIIGENNIIRIVNKGYVDSIDFDPVTHVAPEILGFEHVGQEVVINESYSAFRHMLDNVAPAAAPLIDSVHAGTFTGNQNTLSDDVKSKAKSLLSYFGW